MKIDPDHVTRTVNEVGDLFGLAGWYRDCVRPLLRQPREQWPSCCGGSCEPCNQTLVAVAEEVMHRLGVTEPLEAE